MKDNSESLNYRMIQDSEISNADKLEKYSGTVDWGYLEKHFQNGALIYVDESLDIKEVGQSISEDNKDQVSSWLNSGDILKPGTQHAEHWKRSETVFRALIVTPFVLIQENISREQD